METPVVFEERQAAGGRRIGIATLTRERALNSLTLETIDLLAGAFYPWMDDDDVVCIVLQSASDRAFSAGADIQALYREIQEHGTDNAYGRNFFTHEYRLDHAIATSPKPILSWGHGLVIGGGFGLLAACSHRVGTATTRLAMPEITIGLFPDAGGTWHLSHLREGLGYFMGLTGCQISATDGKDLGLLDFLIDDGERAGILDGLTALAWTGDPGADRAVLTAYLEASPGHLASDGPDLIRFAGPVGRLIESCLADSAGYFNGFSSGLDALPDDPWLSQAINTFRNGSALTARIFIEQMARGRTMSLAETLQMELMIAWQCLRHGEFAEGVRALMIDKDRDPKWHYPEPREVPGEIVARHFEPSWSGAHPLDLS
ncbi:MAG: enoyl-CoA hydratase/isomerase family protein [Proteobacteria bacterium]|nr:enoyl-CoA hydratase/isomerase family protein [Pseudomonadota bacterium]MDA1300180.1 enoyl-CoA hydratase/isomerase family protein [Pseudomonadota bacterium]